VEKVCNRPDYRVTPFGCCPCYENDVQTHCNSPDSRATPSIRDFNMETREVCYGKAVAQFTVRNLYASNRMLPREIQISGDLSFLSLYK
jgi:hypothetical protein